MSSRPAMPAISRVATLLGCLAGAAESRGVERTNFVGREHSPSSGRKVRVTQRTDACASEPNDRVTDRRTHPPHHPLATLLHDDRERRRATRRFLEDLRLRGAGRTVIELDAGSQRAQRSRRRLALHLDEVLLFHAVTRMAEQLRQLTVVRQQEETLGFEVETTDGEDP